ncbi:MAG: hypothetical protein CMI52_02495 [Parcubacteria group bacterium]|nr:hypothetical protein [Parcubacteria group bacterium]
MKGILNILVFAVVIGVIVSGLLGIMIVLDLAGAAESKEALIKTAQVIGILTATSIVALLALKLGNLGNK